MLKGGDLVLLVVDGFGQFVEEAAVLLVVVFSCVTALINLLPEAIKLVLDGAAKIEVEDVSGLVTCGGVGEEAVRGDANG